MREFDPNGNKHIAKNNLLAINENSGAYLLICTRIESQSEQQGCKSQYKLSSTEKSQERHEENSGRVSYSVIRWNGLSQLTICDYRCKAKRPSEWGGLTYLYE